MQRQRTRSTRGTRIALFCHHCASEFYVHPYRAATAMYCDRACKAAARVSRRPLSELDPQVFWSRVRKSEECWEWQATHTTAGYGSFTFGMVHYYAHRTAFRLATGRDPGDLYVMHSCDNPPCCNPSHLSLGTNADNHADMKRKGRGRGRHSSKSQSSPAPTSLFPDERP